VTLTAWAIGKSNSLDEVVIPHPQKLLFVLRNEALDLLDLSRPVADLSIQEYRIQPKLRREPVSKHMYVRRFTAVTGVEVETVGAYSQGWYLARILK
jgi:hypothetical protein